MQDCLAITVYGEFIYDVIRYESDSDIKLMGLMHVPYENPAPTFRCISLSLILVLHSYTYNYEEFT